MTQNFLLSRPKTALLVIDVQEKLFPYVERGCEVMQKLQTAVKGFQALQMPIFVTEQYPQGLGSTMPGLKQCLGPEQSYFTKTSFSCLGDEKIRSTLMALPYDQWVLVGIEAHVCVLQSAKDLMASNKQVIVLNDAISSRSIYDFSTAIAEMRDIGVRISSAETILFELLRDSKASEFKQISQLIK